MSTDLLDLTALAPADCATILTAATAWKSDPSLVPQVLNGTGAAAIFTICPTPSVWSDSNGESLKMPFSR